MIKVSVILPTFQSEQYLAECLDSIFQQTFQDFEILLINELGNDDKTLEIALSYNDRRLNIVQNETWLGLHGSLNRGINLAKGEYLARIDADDWAHPLRFEKQVSYLDRHPRVGVCGSYQLHFGNKVDWIHKPPVSHEQIKSNLLFSCDLCHSTLMLRKKSFIENELLYKDFKAEDYELWLRATKVIEFYTIPEVLGKYRVSTNSITNSKIKQLDTESGELVLRTLSENLNLHLPPELSIYFQGWENPFYYNNISLGTFRDLLSLIYYQNKTIKYYNEECLSKTLTEKWNAILGVEKWNHSFEAHEKKKLLINNRVYKVKFFIRRIVKKIQAQFIKKEH